MPLHLSTDGVVTKCGLPVGELVLDGCTGDPDLFDCPECEDNLGRPYAAAAAALDIKAKVALKAVKAVRGEETVAQLVAVKGAAEDASAASFPLARSRARAAGGTARMLRRSWPGGSL